MCCHKSAIAICLAMSLLVGGTAKAAESLKDTIEDLSPHACKDVDKKWQLTCITLEAPTDHRTNSGPPIKLEFAISFAAEQPSKGIIVFAAGGPGQSGLQYANKWLGSYEDLTKSMDVVFFDQRGVGLHNKVTCPKAETKFNLENPSIMTPTETIAIAKSFATDCPAEFASQDLVDFLDTDQAIQDLEIFRQRIDSQIWIYGMSYGTQFAQRYATIFPDSVKGVILDGVVDLNLDFEEYYSVYVQAAEGILTRVFKACADLEACRTDMPTPSAVYDALAAQAADKPIKVDFPLGDGTFKKRDLTRNMIETSAYQGLYDPDKRAAFLRALAAASQDNLLPLLQLSYSELGVNPQTLEPVPDRSDSAAAYYAITCSDYGEGSEDSAATAEAILAQAKVFAAEAPRRLLEFYYMERLVCAFWPKRGPVQRPAQYAGGTFPTLVLNADADPITPLVMAKAVSDNAHASLITQTDGPHVIWAWGNKCVDDQVYDLLLGTSLAEEIPECSTEGGILGTYTKLTSEDDAETAKGLAIAVDTEIWQSFELSDWDRSADLRVGCDLGGTITVSTRGTVTPSAPVSEYKFDNCSWWPNIQVNGIEIVRKKGKDGKEVSVAQSITIGGDHEGTLNFSYNWDKENGTTAQKIVGIYDKKNVSEP